MPGWDTDFFDLARFPRCANVAQQDIVGTIVARDLPCKDQRANGWAVVRLALARWFQFNRAL